MSFFLFDKKETDEKVANSKLLLYAVGHGGQSLSDYFVSMWLRYFAINILKIPTETVGVLFGITYAWDAINDPLVGAYVDKRSCKPYNKLRPYVLWLPPAAGVLAALMFFDINASPAVSVAWVLILYLIWDLVFTFQDTAMWGLIALSSPSSKERARVSQWVSIGSGWGCGIVTVFQLCRSFLNARGVTDPKVFMLFGFVFGLGGELAVMLTHRMKEKTISEPQKGESIWKSIGMLRHNPTLLLISLARFCQNLSPRISDAYFFENSVTFIDGKQAQFWFNMISNMPGTVSVFAASKMAQKLGGMKRILIISQITSIVLHTICFFIGYDSWWKFIMMTILMGAVTIPTALMDTAHRSLTSDSIDEVEYKTGIRTEGVSFAMQNFVTKIGTGAATVIEGFILGKKVLNYSADNNEAGITQNPTFLKWQWPMYMLAPIVGNILYLIVISFITDDKDRRLRIEKELRQRRANGAASAVVNSE